MGCNRCKMLENDSQVINQDMTCLRISGKRNQISLIARKGVELAWRSGSVMDSHATAQSSIPGGNGVFTELHVLRKGQ